LIENGVLLVRYKSRVHGFESVKLFLEVIKVRISFWFLPDDGGGTAAALDSKLVSLGSADGRYARDEVGALDGGKSDSGSGARAGHLGSRGARCHASTRDGGALGSDHLGGHHFDYNTVEIMC
jgi:hypothetical protein